MMFATKLASLALALVVLGCSSAPPTQPNDPDGPSAVVVDVRYRRVEPFKEKKKHNAELMLSELDQRRPQNFLPDVVSDDRLEFEYHNIELDVNTNPGDRLHSMWMFDLAKDFDPDTSDHLVVHDMWIGGVKVPDCAVRAAGNSGVAKEVPFRISGTKAITWVNC